MTGGFLIAALALTGNAAMAANTQVHTSPKAVHVTQPRVAARAAARVAAPRPYAYAPVPLPFGIGQFIQSMLGGPLPPQYAQIVRNAVRESASHQGSDSHDSSWQSPSYDNMPVPIDNSASDAAIAGEEADLNALQQSMQATQEQNDEANAEFNAGIAAAQQTEINAGM
jgi:hypothetical protein